MNPPIIITDPVLLAQLFACTTITNLLDPDGKVVAAFVPHHLEHKFPLLDDDDPPADPEPGR